MRKKTNGGGSNGLAPESDGGPVIIRKIEWPHPPRPKRWPHQDPKPF